MSDRHLKLYEGRGAPSGPLRLAVAAALTRGPVRRRSLLNRQRDYRELLQDPARMALHRRLNEHLAAGAREWDAHDYGEGYFYQSLRRLGITGLRDSESRVAAMELGRHVAGLRVLEIGCNTGFVSALVAEHAEHVTGFDVAPHLVAIAREAAAALEIDNAEFHVSSFEELEIERAYDAVLSFANHSTYDGNTTQPLEQYFDRCRAAVRPGGLLLFESHPPAYEGEDGLEAAVGLLSERFEIQERRVLEHGTFLDRGRTFVVARRPVE